MKRRLWIASMSLFTCLMGSKAVAKASLTICDTTVACTDVYRDCDIWCTICSPDTFTVRHCA
jgi:hypothetical protein